MGFSTAQGSSAHTQCVLKIENFVQVQVDGMILIHGFILGVQVNI